MPSASQPQQLESLPGPVQSAARALRAELAAAFGPGLHALYLYGAVTFPESEGTGDLDYHAILSGPPSNEQRAAYVRQVVHAVKSGGHVIIGTFGPEGPTQCSGLDVIRYDADSLHNQFGVRFRLEESSTELHRTPFGTTQQFLYCYCKVE